MIFKIYYRFQSLFYYLIKYPFFKLIIGKIGSKTRIGNNVRLDEPHNIYLGKKTTIGRYSWLASKPQTGKAFSNLKIGNNCYIGNFAHIYSTSNITIGDNVIIADKVYISDNSHSYNDVTIPIISQPIIQLNEVIIGENSWIGENVCIIGAKVGKHVIVGANSIVKKDIPDYSVVVGNPAKIIKRYSFEKETWLSTDQNGNFIN